MSKMILIRSAVLNKQTDRQTDAHKAIANSALSERRAGKMQYNVAVMDADREFNVIGFSKRDRGRHKIYSLYATNATETNW